ncbi:GDSL esterase/lipase at5g42170 [Phtheirospermum japonicum]|uniref:GDSL esterase/lipase at5g42170 n=1 Tax=Phtheirospermum japonicum TaxID=374723 RepID=A0A830CQ30_9LAMI|nr:GDSL esterase/lipase at5g42170 [Phtheirospermum japonicum]
MSSCEGAIKLPPNVMIPGFFAFRDSIVDQGNNNAIRTLVKCNFPLYGKDFEGEIPTGRFGNGKTPPDLIGQKLGIKELMPAYLDPELKAQDLPTGVSFASGGCGYDPQTSQLVVLIHILKPFWKMASVTPLSSQLAQFKEYIKKLKGAVGEEQANKVLSNNIHMVVAGSDNITNPYFTIGIRRDQYDISSYTDILVSSAFSFMEVHKGSFFFFVFLFTLSCDYEI